MEGDQVAFLVEQQMEAGDVAVSYKYFGVISYCVQIYVWNDSVAAVAASDAENCIDFRGCKNIGSPLCS